MLFFFFFACLCYCIFNSNVLTLQLKKLHVRGNFNDDLFHYNGNTMLKKIFIFNPYGKVCKA